MIIPQFCMLWFPLSRYPVKLFRRRAWCKIMQHYVIKLYNIRQHWIIRGDISPHIRSLIVVDDRFCGDNCPYFNWHILLHNYAAINYMSAIMSQNGQKMAIIIHNAAKKFDWVSKVRELLVAWIFQRFLRVIWHIPNLD